MRKAPPDGKGGAFCQTPRIGVLPIIWTSRAGERRLADDTTHPGHLVLARPERAVVAGVATKRDGIGMREPDITKTNIAVEQLLEVTENPRHRYMLEAYNRHRYLEMAGRYEEIFAPEMTVEHPVYRFEFYGQQLKLDGREQVEATYREWTETDQCVVYLESEELAVGDTMIVSRAMLYQQTLGAALVAMGLDADADAMYLAGTRIVMVWPYDARCRLIGEDVWEYDSSERQFIKLAPDEVLTAEQAGGLLEPLIKPLPSFDDSVLTAA
jgi:hypothetical protein